jgi:mono/diheme cytochrome c family protein
VTHAARGNSPAMAGLFSFIQSRMKAVCGRVLLPALACAFACAATAAAAAEGDAARGRYLASAGGCVGCHTEARKGAVPFAGGRALETPFGVFYGPNITPDPEAGIGRWTFDDFKRAMRHGVRRDGANLFPAFPYPSYTRVNDADLRDLWAFLRTLPPSSQKSREHELGLLYRWRILVGPWKALFFTPGPFVPDPQHSAAVNRGEYLVRGLGHCGECHTPRNAFGAKKADRLLAGGMTPEGKDVPNLTPTGLERWSDEELKDILTSGIFPDGDIISETMGEVIRNTTSKLTPQDLDAMIAYLRSLPPLPDEPQ